MNKTNHREQIAILSESEGIFTTAQAERSGIPRDALHDAVESGCLERVLRGAYRMVGSGSSYTDELAAVWKLTDPARFSHERVQPDDWDGVVVGGSTAASLLEIGDFYLSPYRLYAPRRVNSRNPIARFSRREVERADVSFASGLPVTRPERTIADLVLDDEDSSPVADALRDAAYDDREFDFERVRSLLVEALGPVRGERAYRALLDESGIAEDGREER